MSDVNNETKQASSIAPIKKENRIMGWDPTLCYGLVDVSQSVHYQWVQPSSTMDLTYYSYSLQY